MEVGPFSFQCAEEKQLDAECVIKNLLRLTVCLLISVLAVASATGSTATREQSTGIKTLIRSLRSEKAKVTIGGKVKQPFFKVPGRILNVDGEQVQVFEFKTEPEASAAAGEVDPGGSTVATTSVSWMAPPHFYRKGKIIAIYVGSSNVTIERLVMVMGPQFAGK